MSYKKIVALQILKKLKHKNLHLPEQNLHFGMTKFQQQQNSDHFNVIYPGRLGLADFP